MTIQRTNSNKVKLWNALLIVLLIFIGIAVFFPHSAGSTALPKLDLSKLSKDPAERAQAIMDYVDDLWRGASSKAVLSMNVKTEHWTRTLEMEAWSLAKDYSLVRITAPLKEAGTATLKNGANIYNYLPKTDRTIKITSGMMMSSWMGSHFTNDDLVKESRYATDYNSKVIFEGERAGDAIWEIQLDPKADAAVVWGKVVFTVSQRETMPIDSKYYDEKGNLVRTMYFSDYKTMSGRMIPASMRLEPADKPGEFTQLAYKDIQFDLDLTRDFFSLQNLKR
jgi:hypothetical protein